VKRQLVKKAKSGAAVEIVPQQDLVPNLDAPEEGAEWVEEKGPLRCCILTRVREERGKMIRFVLAPTGEIVPDLAAKLPGRGLWLSARADVIEAALRKDKAGKAGLARVFARSARDKKNPGKNAGQDQAVSVILPEDLQGLLIGGLRRRVSEHLGLARRAGQAVAGFTKAREWLQTGRAGLVIAASDGSIDERRRLLSGVGEIPVAWPMEAAALGKIFGRDHAVHVAVAPGRIAEALMNDIERLAGISGQVLKAGG